jgi:hypothetical protein
MKSVDMIAKEYVKLGLIIENSQHRKAEVVLVADCDVKPDETLVVVRFLDNQRVDTMYHKYMSDWKFIETKNL